VFRLSKVVCVYALSTSQVSQEVFGSYTNLMVSTENLSVNREQSYSENFVIFIDECQSSLNYSLKQKKQRNSSKICCCLLHNRNEFYLTLNFENFKLERVLFNTKLFQSSTSAASETLIQQMLLFHFFLTIIDGNVL